MRRHSWDGEWYRRGYFDDGTPLGSRANKEARIDSLPQSWAVLSEAARPERAASALRAAERHLVLEADKLILLFDPPFDHSAQHPGYIMGYPPGVRENGGQYTHAALWLAQAFARLKQGTRAVELLEMINPVERTRSSGRSPTLQRRAVCDRGGYLQARGAGRPLRMDLVYGLQRVDVSRVVGRSARVQAPGAPAGN